MARECHAWRTLRKRPGPRAMSSPTFPNPAGLGGPWTDAERVPRLDGLQPEVITAPDHRQGHVAQFSAHRGRIRIVGAADEKAIVRQQRWWVSALALAPALALRRGKGKGKQTAPTDRSRAARRPGRSRVQGLSATLRSMP